MTDAAPFDPSILDSKSKDELIAIATTLGPKPSARAKKADLIAHILDLVGAPASADQATDRAAGERQGADADPSADGPAAGADERAPSSAAAVEATSSEQTSGAAGSKAADAAAGGAAGSRPGAARSDGAGRGERSGGRNGPDRSGSAGEARSQGGGSPRKQSGGRGDHNEQSNGGGPRADGGDGAGRSEQRNDGGERPSNAGGNDRSGGQRSDRTGGSDGNRSGSSDAAGPGNQADPRTNEGDSDDDAGNRRRPRRRGRDREREGGEQAQPEPLSVEGLVDLRHEGYGFLRVNGFLPSRDDAYISVKQTRQFGLRTGDRVGGKARPANRNEKNPALLQVERVNGHPSHSQPSRRVFEDLTPLFPDERLRLELADDPTNTTVRIIDLVAPIGKGQRGLIVSPPKAGKTTIVKHIVRSIETNHPEVELMVLLVDERPEEVTDMKRWLLRGSVAASTFDRPADEHISVAELVIERAKRLVEDGKDVVVVLDGITRLARAYNLAAPATGRTMAGGIETGALYPPKKFFGAARNAEEGGSLTILATALVETNTRMDEVIFEEFKGTGNMELKLDRKLAERRIFPAIDVDASSTRHEELLFDRRQLAQVWKLRRVLGALRDESGSSASGLEMLTDRLSAFKTNDAFLDEVAKTTGA